MSDVEYEVILANATDTSQIPKDKGIFYRCLECGDVIPSLPDDNIACSCRSICIDIDMWRLYVRDYDKMEAVRVRRRNDKRKV